MPDLRIVVAIAVAVLLVFVLVPRLVQPPPQEIHVTLSEWTMGFETITILGGKLKFVVTNAGTMPHGFEIEGEINGEEVEWVIEPFPPGETRTLKVDLPPGHYEVYCPVPGHREKGMEAELVVH